MADFVSHHLFGEQMLAIFPASVQELTEQHPACFFWGCQGPDPLFYRKILLGSPLHRLGNRMHSERTDELFAALLRGVRALTGTAHEAAAAYFYGFLCHYALDSQVHPYVYFRQEQLRASNPRLTASSVHCQVESDIDWLLYERAYHQPATSFRPEEHYTLSAADKATLSVLLRAVLISVYGETVSPHDLRRSFEEMLEWQNFFYARHDGVYAAAQRMERLAGRGAILTGHMKLERPAWDALNLEQSPWYNLWEPDKVQTASVLELFALARIRAASLAGQYAAQFGTRFTLCQHFEIPFDNGSPKKLPRK